MLRLRNRQGNTQCLERPNGNSPGPRGALFSLAVWLTLPVPPVSVGEQPTNLRNDYPLALQASPNSTISRSYSLQQPNQGYT